MNEILLEAVGVRKRFGGAVALDGVNFALRPGEVHAICGENGAGKSTLIRVLSGFYPWTTIEGQLFWNGKPLRLDGIRSGEEIGIAVVHQEFSLIREMTIAENLFMGRLPQRRGLVDRSTMIARSREMLQRFGVRVDPEMKVGKLGVPMQQLVEIAKAMARSPKVLILDEPTAALGTAETELLLDSIRRLRDRGVSCIYISHKLEEVMAIADRVSVLRDGCSIATYRAEDCTQSRIVRDMVGRQIDDIYPPKRAWDPGSARLRIQHLSAQSDTDRAVQLQDISLEVRSGEIVGIGGLMGAGRSELLMHVFGLWGARTQGEVEVNGRPYPNADPRTSLEHGLMMVTEDRKRFGLIQGHSTMHNVSLSSLPAMAAFGWIDRLREHRRTGEVLTRTHFRALSDQTEVERLSGGNQQKVVFARGLLCEPHILLLDEPTRGVDVGARSELYRQIQTLAHSGKAILWVSSDLSELIGMCDRIIMMREGRTTAPFDRRDGFDSSTLIATAMGHTPGQG